MLDKNDADFKTSLKEIIDLVYKYYINVNKDENLLKLDKLAFLKKQLKD
jgi:hypothetical protein